MPSFSFFVFLNLCICSSSHLFSLNDLPCLLHVINSSIALRIRFCCRRWWFISSAPLCDWLMFFLWCCGLGLSLAFFLWPRFRYGGRVLNSFELWYLVITLLDSVSSLIWFLIPKVSLKLRHCNFAVSLYPSVWRASVLPFWAFCCLILALIVVSFHNFLDFFQH